MKHDANIFVEFLKVETHNTAIKFKVCVFPMQGTGVNNRPTASIFIEMAVTCVNKTLAVGQQTEQKETANMIALICDTRYLTSHLSQASKNEACTSHQTNALMPYCSLEH
jgi:hypothetical protein